MTSIVSNVEDVGEPPDPPLDDPCGEREPAGRPLHGGAGPRLDVFLSGKVFMDMIFTGLPRAASPTSRSP
jgi:hypothetical protein